MTTTQTATHAIRLRCWHKSKGYSDVGYAIYGPYGWAFDWVDDFIRDGSKYADVPRNITPITVSPTEFKEIKRMALRMAATVVAS